MGILTVLTAAGNEGKVVHCTTSCNFLWHACFASITQLLFIGLISLLDQVLLSPLVSFKLCYDPQLVGLNIDLLTISGLKCRQGDIHSHQQ
jgi:hypothetical protein